MKSHEDIRHRFEDQLEAVRREVVALGLLVVENGRRAAAAFLGNRLAEAAEVMAADDEIDSRYVALERDVYELLARQQPVAGDLRLLVSLTRILYEMERSGDLAVNCAKSMLRQDGFTLTPALHTLLQQMTKASVDLFAEAVGALSSLERDAGKRLAQADDTVDELTGEYYRTITAESDALGLGAAIELSKIGRYFERIADHAVNIGEHVTYIITGAFPRTTV